MNLGDEYGDHAPDCRASPCTCGFLQAIGRNPDGSRRAAEECHAHVWNYDTEGIGWVCACGAQTLEKPRS